jgi:hypothetical protein
MDGMPETQERFRVFIRYPVEVLLTSHAQHQPAGRTAQPGRG